MKTKKLLKLLFQDETLEDCLFDEGFRLESRFDNYELYRKGKIEILYDTKSKKIINYQDVR